MEKYNSAFFSLYENTFIVLKDKLGEEKALELFTKIMEKGLKKSYDAAGFEKGDAKDFARVVGEKDSSVGLHVEFPEVTWTKIVYRFYTDPFPNLKQQVDSKKLVSTYLSFKVKYLLGDDWSYNTSRHIWNGDKFIEHIIQRR